MASKRLSPPSSSGKKERKSKQSSEPSMYTEPDRYFDARFTAEERELLRSKIEQVAGLDCSDPGRDPFYVLYRPIEREIRNTLSHIGWGKEADMSSYVLIRICRDLGIDYKTFARNEPKLSISGFLEAAKRAFPEFRRVARNRTEHLIQTNRLNSAFVDWRHDECARTGCKKDGHWLCADRFEKPDFDEIAFEIAKHNAARPKFEPLRLVHSSD